jgi:hypothetical protein
LTNSPVFEYRFVSVLLYRVQRTPGKVSETVWFSFLLAAAD